MAWEFNLRLAGQGNVGIQLLSEEKTATKSNNFDI